MPHAAAALKPVFPTAIKLTILGVVGGITVASILNQGAISTLIDNNMVRTKDLIESRRIRVYEEEERIKQRKLEWQLLSYSSYGNWTRTRSQVKFLQDKLEHKERNVWDDMIQGLDEKKSS